MDLKRIVKSLPYPLQKSMKYVYSLVPVRLRYVKVFWETYNFLQKSQWWSKEKLEEYQMEQLSKLLNHAYKNVPYYRRVFNERGLKPKDIQDFRDLRKLPLLTKNIVMNNFENLISKNIPKEEMEFVTTGGTTGIPLGLYIEKNTNLKRMAFEWREWNWMGYKFIDRCVVLRGNVVEAKEEGKYTYWEYDRKNNYLILSVYDMTDESLPRYVQKIEEFEPKIIRGYPSALGILARFIEDNNLKINEKGNIKAISTSSENIYPIQRKLIERVFRCPVFDKYGNCEQVSIFGECEKHEGYHDFMEYGYTEILSMNDAPVSKDGEIGEIVSTGFTNYATPLIRYKTGDFVEVSTSKCSCGRNHSLIKTIEGRLQDLVVTKDKRYITLTALIFAQHFESFSRIKEMQIVQEKEGEIIIRILKSAQYSDKDEKEIESKIYKIVKDRLNVKFEYLSHYIPRTKRGKHRFLIQKLPIKFNH